MSALLGLLSGKKTYLLAAVAVVLTGLHVLGYINDTTYNLALTLTGAGTVASLRAGITKSGPPPGQGP